MTSQFVSSGSMLYTFSYSGALQYTCDNAGVVVNLPPAGTTNWQSFSYELDKDWDHDLGPDIVISFTHNGTVTNTYISGPQANGTDPVTGYKTFTVTPANFPAFATGDTLNGIALVFLPGLGGPTPVNGQLFKFNTTPLPISLANNTLPCQAFIQSTFRCP